MDLSELINKKIQLENELEAVTAQISSLTYGDKSFAERSNKFLDELPENIELMSKVG